MGLIGDKDLSTKLMPNGTGGHNSTDYGNGINHDNEEPIRAMVTPRYSDIEVEIPIAYIELVAWWRRFGG